MIDEPGTCLAAHLHSLRSRRSADFITGISAPPEYRGRPPRWSRDAGRLVSLRRPSARLTQPLPGGCPGAIGSVYTLTPEGQTRPPPKRE
jgi:hypothetical protein